MDTTETYGVMNTTSGYSDMSNIIISDRLLANTRFVIYCLIIPVFGTCGIIGNSLAMTVFVEVARKTKQSINTYMLALVSVDSLIMFTSVLRTIPIIVGNFDKNRGNYWEMHTMIPFIYFDIIFNVMNSVILILMSIERLIAIRSPLSAKQTMLAKHPIKLMVMFAFIVMAFVLPLPLLIEVKSSVGLNGTNTYYVGSKDKSVHIFQIATLTISLVCRYAPYIILMILNIAIPVQYTFAVRARLRMFANASFQNSVKTQLRVNATVSVIIFMYTVLNLPQMFVQLLAVVDETYSIDGVESNLFWFMTDISNVLVILNCSVDFLIYILRSETCRARFKQRFCLSYTESSPSTSTMEVIGPVNVVQ